MDATGNKMDTLSIAMITIILCFFIPSIYVWYRYIGYHIKERKRNEMSKYRNRYVWLCQIGLGETAMCFNTYGLKIEQQAKQLGF